MPSKLVVPFLVRALQLLDEHHTDPRFQKFVAQKLSTARALSANRPAPEFALLDSLGVVRHLHDFRGKVLFINFWGTWCGPCRAEMPALSEFQAKFKDDTNLIFLNIAFEENAFEKWKSLIPSLNLRSVQLYAEGRFESPVAKAYDLEFCPAFMILNRDGTIYSSREERPEGGTRTEENLRKALAQE